MTLYEERLSKDLGRLRDEVATIGAAVQTAHENAAQAALTGNRTLANLTIIGDHPINRRVREINRLAHAFLAVHQPSAGHLRLISSILRLVNELERIGDYAVTIAREALQLPHTPTGLLKQEFEQMADQAQTCLRQSMTAFNERNADLARETKALASQAKGRGDTVFGELVEEAEKEQIRYLFDVLIMVGRLKRVADRAKNICEETLFTVTGETKAPKVYKILFLDQENNCQSQLAEAFARKTFPNSGQYNSAGRVNGVDLAPGLLSFMEMHGLAVQPMTPKTIETDLDRIAAHDLVISLDGPMSAYVDKQPFRTVYLEWDVGARPEGADEAEVETRYREIYREISAQVRALMETLRGEEAD
ncbi:MAG: phosphate signaling complex protein PhoU [Alphaproteobacteria bacterium]|nr:phosphate signaling complex protein PhoU [Alphaproteobacteria bacterium]